MFRLIIRNGGGRIAKGKRNDQTPPRPGNWLRQIGIVAASVLFLPIAILSVTIFVGLFLIFLIAVLAYGFWLRSRLQRIESNRVINGDFETVSDEGNQQKLIKGEGDDLKLN